MTENDTTLRGEVKSKITHENPRIQKQLDRAAMMAAKSLGLAARRQPEEKKKKKEKSEGIMVAEKGAKIPARIASNHFLQLQ